MNYDPFHYMAVNAVPSLSLLLLFIHEPIHYYYEIPQFIFMEKCVATSDPCFQMVSCLPTPYITFSSPHVQQCHIRHLHTLFQLIGSLAWRLWCVVKVKQLCETFSQNIRIKAKNKHLWLLVVILLVSCFWQIAWFIATWCLYLYLKEFPFNMGCISCNRCSHECHSPQQIS